MSAALKLASLASGFTLLSLSAFHTFRTPQQDFSKSSLALEHTLDHETAPLAKPKLPSEFVSLTIGGYELKQPA